MIRLGACIRDAVGSLRVSGKICTGFTVHVGGNLEVSGNVEDARIKVQGNILVRGGFNGAGAGEMFEFELDKVSPAVLIEYLPIIYDALKALRKLERRARERT